MKRSLYTKLLLGFLLFGICGFLTVAVLISKLSFEKLKHDEVKILHRTASAISFSLSHDEKDLSSLSENVKSSLTYLSRYLGSQIWIMDSEGDVLLTFTADGFANSQKAIDNFNLKDFNKKNFLFGDFYGSFSKRHLSVLSPIDTEKKFPLYVIIHRPLHDLFIFHTELLDIAYLSWFILLLFAAFLFTIFLFLVYRPIRALSIGAQEYAKGNYDTPIPVHDNDDEIGYIAASLNYMADKLNTIEENQRNFISNVSHDFRSPLTSIRGYINAILDGTIPTEMQEKYLNIILFETERLEKLTESLLELNKYDGKFVALEITDFNINDIIQKTTETFEGACREKHLQFQLLLAPASLRVHADMGKIQQVLYNLIDNAIKFSQTDSQIIIETTSIHEKAYISVKDFGIGVPKDSLNKIWNRFYKIDLSRGRDKRGTGLGLSIVKEIILAHGENINVISTEGVGTEFIFTLTLTR
ncbi:MAG: HAMP domain-containing histidine kinase [Lachnospiraceae bacterium]|nr:HAMP domain-containing histidine kinase [Lachnospiraceae bacterium]